MIDPGWVTAIAAVVTAIIIGGTAIAAFLQIRDFRKVVEIEVSLRFAGYFNTAISGNTRSQVVAAVKQLQDDPELRERLHKPSPNEPGMTPIRDMLREMSTVSWLVIERPAVERHVLRQWAFTLVELWELCLPYLLERRKAGPTLGREFEHLAMRSQHYIKSREWDRDWAKLERDPRTLEAELQPAGA